MTNAPCAHGRSAPHAALKSLHKSQGGTGRHKCVTCAYRLGLEAGVAKQTGTASVNNEEGIERCNQGSSAPTSVLGELPEAQAGVGRHKCPVCAYEQGYKDGLLQQHLELESFPTDVAIQSKPFPDVDEENITAKEGRRRWAQHFRRERNAKIVREKKNQVLRATGSLKCEVCQFDFKKRYGALGEGFCEAHHKQPLSTLDLQTETETKLEDLAILCSNCHRMIHKTKPIMSVTDFKKRYGNQGI